MRLLRCFILLLLPLSGYGQFEPIQSFSVKDGLPSSIVYDCLQDKQGFMWFATAAGLARFDGTNYKVYTMKDGLTNNEVLQVLQDKDGSMWVVPYGNIPCIYDPATQSILNYNNYPELKKFMPFRENIFLRNSAMGMVSFKPGEMISISEKKIMVTRLDSLYDYWPLNKDSAILFFWKSNYYYFFEGGKITGTKKRFEFQVGYFFRNADWGKRKIVYSFDKMHNLALIRFSGNKTIVTDAVYSNGYLINSVQLYNNQFYVNTANGVVITDSLLKVKQHLLKGKSISKTFIDRDGNEWFPTNSGNGVLLRMKNKVHRYEQVNGLPDDNVTAIRFGPGNKMYCGDQKGNLYSLTISQSGIEARLLHQFFDNIRGISLDGNNILAFSTLMLLRNNKMHALSNAAKSILLDVNGDVLVGGSKGLSIVKANGRREDLRTSGIYRSLVNFSGKIYFGNNDGLFRINSLSPYSEEPVSGSNEVLKQPVNHIIATHDSLLWIATNTAGLYALRNGKILAQVHAESGRERLNSNICKKIYADDSNNTIWVGTNKGINRVHYMLSGDSIKVKISSITSADGLNDDDVNDICVNNGKVYAATIKGICVFPVNLQPADIPVEISGIAIRDYDTRGLIQGEYKLKYWQNNISISYAGISFTGNRRQEYEYRFFKEGGDTSWTKTNTTTIEFRELQPGLHIFQVMSATGSMKEIRFYIQRPFWQTTVFYIFLFLLIALLMIWATRIISRNIRKKEAEKTAINKKFSELELRALQAQMNPHFVFNAMNTLQNYILKHESDSAGEYLSRFSRLMRLFLVASRNKFITISNEKELLKNYIELEQARLDHSFQFDIPVDERLDGETEIPSMLVQPFVENAILHGLRHRDDKNGMLIISFLLSGNDIICSISDNGIGRKEAEKIARQKSSIYRSQGMQLVEDKVRTLKAMKNIDIEINIEDRLPGEEMPGTIVYIKIRNINRYDV